MKKHYLRRVLANLLAFGLLFNEVSTPFLVRAEGEDYESEIYEEESVEVPEEDEEVVEEEPVGSYSGAWDAPPAAWTNKVSTYVDTDEHIQYVIYKVGSEYKMLVLPEAEDGHPYREYSPYFDAGENWKYIRENTEEISVYIDNLTEVIFRGIDEVSEFDSLPALKKIYFDDINTPTTMNDCSKLHSSAFEDNPNLEEVYLPAKITEIPLDCFALCPKLKKVAYYDGTNVSYFSSAPLNRNAVYNPEVPVLKEIGMKAFSCDFITVPGYDTQFYPCALEEFPFCSSIESFGCMAFAGCSKLTGTLDLSLNKKVSMERWAFAETGFSSVKLTNTNDIIKGSYPSTSELATWGSTFDEWGVFQGCKNLTSFNFGDLFRDTTLKSNSFEGCSKLKFLYYVDGDGTRLDGIPYTIKELENRCFCDCDAITQARFEQIADDHNIQKIGSYCFSMCDGITEVRFDGEIGDYCFYKCTGITDVSVDGTIGNGAFQDCANLRYVNVSGKVGENAFSGTQSNYVSVSSVSLDKDTLILDPGETDTLTATLTPDNASIKTMEWKSSAPAVATVDSTGKVTAVAKGTADITVTTDDSAKTATCSVTVAVPVTGVTISPKTLEIYEGAAGKVSASVLPADATVKDVSFSSADHSIATVSSDGTVSGIKAGTTTITVTTERGGFTDTCAVTVKEVKVTGVTISPNTLTLKPGSNAKLAISISPENASNKGVNIISTDPSVATVDNEGNISALKNGTTVLVVTTKDGGFTATCNVTVADNTVAVESISVSPDNVTLVIGEKKALSVSILPENASNKSVSFESGNTEIASVSETGEITAVAKGETNITVTSTDGNKTASCKVTVIDPSEIISVNSVSVSPESVSLKAGESKQLTVSILPEDATNKTVSFVSSDTNIATVTDEGLITAVGTGSDSVSEAQAVITVTTEDGEKTASCVVTVTKDSEGPVDPVSDLYTVSFYNGNDLLYKETVSDGSLIVNVPVARKDNAEFAGWYNIEDREFWNPDTPVYKSISVYARFKDKAGNLEPIAEDEDILESYDDIFNKLAPEDIYLVKGQKVSVYGQDITSSDKSIVAVGKAKDGITLITAKKPGVTELSLTNVSGNTVKHKIHVGTPAFDSKTIKIAVGETKNIGLNIGSDTDKYRVIFSSSNPDSAVIRDGGVYGLSKGSSVITAHVNGKKYTCKVTVSDPVSPKVIEEGADLTLAPLQTFKLKFSDKFNAKKASWEIENPAIVSIKKGKLTATGVGKTKVTGSFDGKSKSFSISVLAPKPQTLHINAGKSKTVNIYKLSNKKAVWSTSNNAVAEVNKGKIKGVSCGVTEITATYAGFTFRTFVVVEDPAVATDAKLSLNGKKYNLTLEYGDTYLLTTKGTTQQVVFTSNKPEIARIGKDGKVYCCGTGKAKLTAKVNGKTITINVTVNSKSL